MIDIKIIDNNCVEILDQQFKPDTAGFTPVNYFYLLKSDKIEQLSTIDESGVKKYVGSILINYDTDTGKVSQLMPLPTCDTTSEFNLSVDAEGNTINREEEIAKLYSELQGQKQETMESDLLLFNLSYLQDKYKDTINRGETLLANNYQPNGEFYYMLGTAYCFLEKHDEGKRILNLGLDLGFENIEIKRSAIHNLNVAGYKSDQQNKPMKPFKKLIGKIKALTS